MESHVQSRGSGFPWTMQPDPWETRFDNASRCSSYSMKYPEMKSSDYETLKPASSSYVHWNRGNASPTGGFSWQQTPSALMFQYPTGIPHFKEDPAVYRSSGENPYGKNATTNAQVSQALPAPEETSYGSSLDTNSSGTGKAKRHVKSACNNCKRAHLSCDDSRPCHRCRQGGKISGCYDLPQKRKGRPRLANHVKKSGRDVNTKTLVIKPITMAQDHRAMNPFTYFDSYPDISLVADHCNDYSAVPAAFLDMDLRLVRINQHFNGLFGYLGDLYGRKLEHLIETIDLGLLENIRRMVRQEMESIMSQPGAPPQALEFPDAARVPSPDSPDTANMYRSVVGRVRLHFRFSDRATRPLAVDFSIARAATMFVTLTFPPLRPAAGIINTHPQHGNGNVYSLQSPFGQAFDATRGYFARPNDRSGPLPSPDSSSYPSASPSSASFSLSSTSSSLPPTSRHASIASQRSYEIPFSTSMNLTMPPQQNIPTTVGSPVRKLQQTSNISLPQSKAYQSDSSQLAPLQDKGQSILNSRTLPPLPGLGSGSSSTQDPSGTDGRGQQSAWPSPDTDATSHSDKRQDTWRNENSNTGRNRLDMKELAS